MFLEMRNFGNYSGLINRRVKLRRNLDPQTGLYAGLTGIILCITPAINKPDVIVVKFDTIEQPIKLWAMSNPYINIDSNRLIHVNSSYYPISLDYSTEFHEQGANI